MHTATGLNVRVGWSDMWRAYTWSASCPLCIWGEGNIATSSRAALKEGKATLKRHMWKAHRRSSGDS